MPVLVLPTTLQVGPHKYSLKRDRTCDSEQAWGKTDARLRIILFGYDCDGEQLPITLVHELVHVAALAYRVELTEDQVGALANGIAQGLQSMGILPEQAILEGEGC